ncbi:hypothetical protein ACXDF8_00630 [Mycolicibacterium sp. CBM1]
MAFTAGNPAQSSPVIVVLGAGTDRGFTLASALLYAGYRVVASDKHAGALVRIAHGHSSDRVLLVAAEASDPRQLERLVDRAREHFDLNLAHQRAA